MAILYSSLFAKTVTRATASGEESTSTAWKYRGPEATRKGEAVVITGSYDLANGTLSSTNTTLRLCPLPVGGRVISCQIAPDADNDSDSNLTFDLGTLATANAYVNDSTALQATTGFSLPATIATDLAQAIPIAASEFLIITRVAGELNATGTLYFTVTVTCG